VAVISVLDFQFNPDTVEDALKVVHAMLEDTRKFKGCVRVDVVQDVTNPGHVLFVEQWESHADDQAYRAWRAGAGSGSGAALGQHLSAAPAVTVSQVRDDV
jgi:quinol monooxygenase YgiN